MCEERTDRRGAKEAKSGSAGEDEAKLQKRNQREPENLRGRTRKLKSSTRKKLIDSFIRGLKRGQAELWIISKVIVLDSEISKISR